MSTRCQIGFYEEEDDPLENWEALIYRHSDGYPDSDCGVINNIVPIIKEFVKERGYDIEYLSAWMVAKLKTNHYNIGICKSIHGDIEYYYAISPKSIRVFKTNRDCKFSSMMELENFKYNFKNEEKS